MSLPLFEIDCVCDGATSEDRSSNDGLMVRGWSFCVRASAALVDCILRSVEREPSVSEGTDRVVITWVTALEKNLTSL